MHPDFENRGNALGQFIEECGEALSAAGKAVRYGLDSYNPLVEPSKRESNREWLVREIQDIEHAISLLRQRKIIPEVSSE